LKKKITNKTPGGGAKRIRNATTKEMSPLTPAKTRTNVRKDIGKVRIEKIANSINSVGQSNQPQGENLRRKTRSTAASKRYGK
jgi:hypothetical protein